MSVAGSTKVLGLKYLDLDGTDFIDIPEWQNPNAQAVEKAVATFDYLASTYGYTYTQSDSEETGATTIVVTLGSTSPVAGTLTAVISENEQGETVAEVTTTIDGETVNGTHTIGDEGGEGGPDNG